jgi:hypothetical protein
LAVLVQGAKAGGQVPAPIAAKIVEEILALDKGYDPGVKPLEAAVGNFDFVESINFKDPVVRAPTVPADEETAEIVANPIEVKQKVVKTKTVKPDIRPEADDHRALSRVQPVQPEKQRGFFDFFKRKPKEEKPSRSPQVEQKHRLLRRSTASPVLALSAEGPALPPHAAPSRLSVRGEHP